MAELKPVQITAAVALASGESITAVAEKVGVSRQAVHAWLNDENFNAYINSLKHESVNAARSAIQAAASLAVSTMSDLMANSQNDGVRLACAKEILSMLGLEKKQAIGSESAQELKRQKENDAKFKAKMAMFD